MDRSGARQRRELGMGVLTCNTMSRKARRDLTAFCRICCGGYCCVRWPRSLGRSGTPGIV